MKKRFDEVDLARALGIIGVIAVHILTHSLTNPVNKLVWNCLQFFVITFVFCSGFVLTHAYSGKLNTITESLSWYKKRLVRLAIPFWIYLIVHYSLWLAFPNVFRGLGLTKSFKYFIDSALFMGGTNFNFLPLLFIELMVLFPLFLNWFKKKKILYTYLFFSILITLIFTFAKFPYSLYRFTMWVPWSLVLILAMYFKESKFRQYITFGLISLFGFLAIYFINPIIGKDEIFYNHKYPPDFFYILFGISITLFLLILGKSNIFQNKWIKKSYNFVSRNSYKIFFIHWIILDAVLAASSKVEYLHSPVIQFVIILFPALAIGFVLEKFQKRFDLL